jgi:hypothetical protein
MIPSRHHIVSVLFFLLVVSDAVVAFQPVLLSRCVRTAATNLRPNNRLFLAVPDDPKSEGKDSSSSGSGCDSSEPPETEDLPESDFQIAKDSQKAGLPEDSANSGPKIDTFSV